MRRLKEGVCSSILLYLSFSNCLMWENQAQCPLRAQPSAPLPLALPAAHHCCILNQNYSLPCPPACLPTHPPACAPDCRLCLERGSSAAEAVGVLTSLLEEHGQGGPCEEGGAYAGTALRLCQEQPVPGQRALRRCEELLRGMTQRWRRLSSRAGPQFRGSLL